VKLHGVLTSQTDPVSGHARPYVMEDALSRSLHFASYETQSRMWLSDPTGLALDYTQTMMGFLLFQPQPARIAMIGLGGGSLAKFCHHHLADARIEVVEINPHVIALRDQFLVPADDERLSIREGDGADFIRGFHAQLDVVLVDGYDRNGINSRVCSQAFYDDCRESLRPGGLISVNLSAAHSYYDTFIERIEQSFGKQHLVVRDFEKRNDIVFAWIGEVPLEALCGDGRPAEIPADTWTALTAAMSRVRRAWKLRPRG